MAWKIARPNAIIALVGMYETSQELPLPNMYGKNLIFKTGGVDAKHCQDLVNLISEGKINTDFMITHKFKLDEIEKIQKQIVSFLEIEKDSEIEADAETLCNIISK